MPELPEVESTARYLHHEVAGEQIASVTVLWERTLSGLKAAQFSEMVQHRIITRVFRRAKWVVFELAETAAHESLYLYIHLRMTGSFDVLRTPLPPEKHDRVIFTTTTGASIRFHDPRKFGRMKLVTDRSIVDSTLGEEPLEDGFTVERLTALLSSRSGAIKRLLLDQRFIAGLGNIYVDEALWYAQIHPLRTGRQIRAEEWQRLHRAIQQVLTEAISRAGTDFGDGVVYGGGYTPVAYGRDGKPCQRCGNELIRTVVGQRGTHLCTVCQPRRIRKSATQRKRAHDTGNASKPTHSTTIGRRREGAR